MQESNTRSKRRPNYEEVSVKKNQDLSKRSVGLGCFILDRKLKDDAFLEDGAKFSKVRHSK